MITESLGGWPAHDMATLLHQFDPAQLPPREPWIYQPV